MFLKSIVSLFFVSLAITVVAQSPDGASRYVNPFIGASTNTASSYHGLGKTFPGAATPFGMTQVSPNTITGGDNGSGYSYEHKTIEGFAFTQMSGVGWYGDLGNFLVMPSTGPLHVIAGKEGSDELQGYRSTYDKSSETAQAGYYSVFLDRYQIKAEATASPYGGMLRFTFPENDTSRIQIDLARRVGGTSTRQSVEVVDGNTIKGWIKCDSTGGGWGDGDGHPDYTVYFYAEFSKPLLNYGFWAQDVPDGQERKNKDVASLDYQRMLERAKIIPGASAVEADHVGFYLEFPTRDQEQVLLKVGISFTDMQGAENNFFADVKGKNFRTMQELAQKAWDDALGKIDVKGGTEDEKSIFYTALYHTMIDPRNITDVDGRYPRPNGKVHASEGFTKRTIFSGWDVFRSQFPLQTIINPKMVNEEINSLISLAQQSNKNYLERWEFFNAYSGCMIGNPALSVISDAYAKGIRGFNQEEALDLMIKTSEKFGNSDLGYVPVETGFSISETLEYAYTDWCIAQMAKNMGKKDIYEKYMKRGQYYRNIFDTRKDWFRPKHKDGSWEKWPEEGRLKEWYGSIEANAYQQGWFVPHDVEGMVELMGGREKVLADLTAFFENTPKDFLWNKYYNHANEPVHHVPFLFNRLGAPELTQKWTRYICEHAYKNEVEGLTGNEDVGQMSAWYVLAASGIHPIAPGDPVYEITSPVFEEITFKLDNGKQFNIVATGNSKENIYIQSVSLNGKPLEKMQISHADLLKGGTLKLEMGAMPKLKN